MAVARQRIRLPRGSWSRALAGLVRGRLWDGEAIERFERAFAEFVGVPRAVAVPSGRAGLGFIFQAMQLERGAEVICSAFGYPVVPHLARSLGYEVRFADCELQTLGMDPQALARVISPRTKAVIATHLYGVPCRIREIAEIAEAHGARLIEDCAHCFGASAGGRKVGAFGSFAYFSFETSKPINTMGGGMITTRDVEAAERLRDIAKSEPGKNLKWLLERLSKTSFEAMVTHPLVFNLGVYPVLRLIGAKEGAEERYASGYQRDEVTLRGRMGRYTNYQAELGLGQMERAQSSLDRRLGHAERLMARLGDRVRFQRNEEPDVRSNFMLVTALFSEMREVSRRLLREGVDTKHHYMRDCSRLLDDPPDFPNAARAEREVLHLPAYPELDPSQIDRIADRVARVVGATGSPRSDRPVQSHASARTPEHVE